METHTIEAKGKTYEVEVEGSLEHLAFFGSVKDRPDISDVGGEDVDEVLDNIRDRLTQAES
mgnify:FL=1